MPSIDDLDTPAIVIDAARAEANIRKAQAHADAHGLKLRPHIKTHKLPYWAKKQIAAGAVGITCQKIGEAEVMADAGLTDIFLPYNILGRAKLERLKALHGRVTLSVTADSLVTLEGLAATFADAGHPLQVLVECDTGMGRCGVQTADEAVVLAKAIDSATGLTLGGLMTYPAAGKQTQAESWLAGAKQALAAAGLDCRRISSGGTPDMWRSGENSVVTEYRPGTYIYLDRYQVAKGVGSLDDCALTVLATVVSHPTPTRAILDSGSKALSSDTLGLSDFGELLGVPGARVTGLSEEHGNVTLSDGAKLRIGERVRVVPDHCCVVTNLFDQVHLIDGDKVLETLPVAARGRMG
ncbi:MAG: D-TA family PLP-dependent enzyme [Mesorhizobium sp.]|uniref:D-TA family PLP-dependent enzyme n=1 Tax=unclassified Mesorhizobium TaxID=325217 RepID=UPI000F763F36|nr:MULTISPECIES: D-TA family PLP-dependent enzyme [unclassified Mesorhizobium]AZO47563.1 D-TA family PLP-dependent enzyme [Mesorhizobium sp. M4B.F.Ca.ET.058.02.1.1]RVC42687.1 D-TA family PLP-dependent enzyme [Mesorhizobium sp. M4A.F.Ca.ET.090.04.2.1]RWC37465.1 MAG: D-TA family PLP-dependent enzyme [Mesorhizobium sp.]RWD13256.1 MAG: D-TA family PLP-dependent enzyme [Mesorhizobium sp.]RWD53315.1 MAG: D-TA family PLP-dependent enzyme [Mesorhizobium sp.]